MASGAYSRTKGRQSENGVADYLGGQRVSRPGEDGHDVEVGHFAIEVKNRKSGAGIMATYFRQAEAQCPDGLTPMVVAIDKHPGGRSKPIGQAFAMVRLEVFKQLLDGQPSPTIDGIINQLKALKEKDND